MEKFITFRNLFFVEENAVVVYKFMEDKKKFEYLKRDGSKKYPITKDFWTWWKGASDYVEEGDKVDFCFIYDAENTLVSDKFLENIQSVEKSCWNKKTIQGFFDEMIENTHIELSLPDGKILKFDKPDILFGGEFNKSKRFYTNIMLGTECGKVETGQNDMADLSLYFKEMRRKEKEDDK